ncbi:hypothetical protein [Nocardioides speluncae]|uniref:hypothetical protein n=1 Tax=Nocardioides speluncae TaxID=2670337 RepID=UPI000D693437|nr:hypothetical protein [Nocardioides speluncae]
MAEEGGGGGVSMEEQIAEAAIKADMEHRGWSGGNGSYYKQEFGSSKNGVHPHYEYHLTKEGLRIEKSPNVDNEDLTAQASSMLSRLQSEVLNYWPRAIDDLFRKWQDAGLPSWGGLAMNASWAKEGADEIRPGTTIDDNGSNLQVGNARLTADLGNLEKRTGQLAGNYARAFSDNYVTPLPPVLQGQFALGSVLAISLEAEKEIWLNTSRDLDSIRHHGLNAMRASAPKTGGGGVDAKVIVTVFAALAGAVAAFATAGGSLAVTAALTAAGAGAWSNLLESPPKKEPEPVPLGAGHPRDVRTNIEKALEKLNEGIRTQEEFLQQILRGANEVAGSKRGAFDLPPAAAEGTVLGKEQDVVVTAEIIAAITAQWIPCIAGDLRLARTKLGVDTAGSFDRPGGIGVGFNGPQPEFKALQETVIGLLGNTATELDEAGAALLSAARTIGLADQAAQAKYEGIAKQINDTNQNTAA